MLKSIESLRGSNQEAMRLFNDRIVLEAIRRQGPQTKAELARTTGLSAQALGLITNRLLEDGLLTELELVRGKVGQPSVPLALHAKGAFSIGVKIGRRKTECLLVDFTGVLLQRRTIDYAFPDASSVFQVIARDIADLTESLGEDAKRLTGVGVAAPFLLGGWHEVLKVSGSQSLQWNKLDIVAEVAKLTNLPVSFARDTAAACIAELHLGQGRALRNYLYLFVDTFLGGGVVLNSQLLHGVNGNAGAVASLPTSIAQPGQINTPQQMLVKASLWDLEQSFLQHDLDPSAAYDERATQKVFLEHTESWLNLASLGLAQTIVSGTCFLDMESVVIDGAMESSLLDALIKASQDRLQLYSVEGIWTPKIVRGTVGSDAGALGGALLPLQEYFAGKTVPLLSPKPMRA